MKSGLRTLLTILVFVVSTTAFAQGFIPQCREAQMILTQYGKLGDVATLVKNACPDMHNGRWLNGTGDAARSKDVMVAEACRDAWASVNANQAVAAAGMALVTRNCPQMYNGLGWRLSPVAGANFAGCVQALQSIQGAGVTTQAGNAVEFNCTQLYQNGWLISAGDIPKQACTNLWNILTNAKQLPAVQTMVTHNCNWLYNSGNAHAGGPIVP